MKIDMEDFQTGWYGISIGVKIRDIDSLIKLLTDLKNDNGKHFHLSSDYAADGGIGDIEIYVQDKNEPDNMDIQP